MKIEHIVEYVKHKLLTDEHKFNQGTFLGRYNRGKIAEMLFMVALERGVILNYGNYYAEETIPELGRKEAQFNALNGDVSMRIKRTSKHNYPDGLRMQVDVKSTEYIAMDSLDRFVDGGWYFLNALTITESMGYTMIRNNKALHEYLEAHWNYFKDGRGRDGIILPFSYIPGNPYEYGLEMYEHVSANKYLNLIRELKCLLSEIPGAQNIIYEKNDPDPVCPFMHELKPVHLDIPKEYGI